MPPSAGRTAPGFPEAVAGTAEWVGVEAAGTAAVARVVAEVGPVVG